MSMQSKKANNAVDYIQRTTKSDFKEKSLVNEGKIVVDSYDKKTYQHEVVANQILKIINVVPGLSKMAKQVMSMKIVNPGISNMQVALACAIREEDVKKYEKHGKEMCAVFMKRCSVEDAQGKFNADRIIENEIKNLNKLKHNPLMAC